MKYRHNHGNLLLRVFSAVGISQEGSMYGTTCLLKISLSNFRCLAFIKIFQNLDGYVHLIYTVHAFKFFENIPSHSLSCQMMWFFTGSSHLTAAWSFKMLFPESCPVALQNLYITVWCNFDHIFYLVINIALQAFLNKVVLFKGESAPQSNSHVGMQECVCVCVLLPVGMWIIHYVCCDI